MTPIAPDTTFLAMVGVSAQYQPDECDGGKLLQPRVYNLHFKRQLVNGTVTDTRGVRSVSGAMAKDIPCFVLRVSGTSWRGLLHARAARTSA